MLNQVSSEVKKKDATLKKTNIQERPKKISF